MANEKFNRSQWLEMRMANISTTEKLNEREELLINEKLRFERATDEEIQK